MCSRNKIIEKFFDSHQKQKVLVETTGKFKRWQMPKNAVVMPFYSKRSKIKNKIRSSKMDSSEFAKVGKEEMLKAG